MTLREGFNRLGISVALTFVVLAVVCIGAAGSNYVNYRSELVRELERRSQDRAVMAVDAEVRRQAVRNSPEWTNLTTVRFKSVRQSLQLSGLCVIASVLSLLFWCGIGKLSDYVDTARPKTTVEN
ncbi:MAG: hypothetical protein ACR2PA_02360 [Hyphomicrobiaceae bacterium]